MLEVIAIATLSAIIVGYAIYRLVNSFFMGPFYYRKLDWFMRYPAKECDIVFAGDSLTDWGFWNEMFPEYPVLNRGIGNERIKGLYSRLENLVEGHPAKIFIMIGTNDLPHLMFHDDRYILTYYKLILNKIKTYSPETRVYIQSILPRQKIFARRIVKLNQELKTIASEFDIPFIDIYSHLVGEEGELRRDFTNDKLHLMAEGYRLWGGVVRPYVTDEPLAPAE